MNVRPLNFNFIQQKSPTPISGEMNAGFYQFSRGSNPDRMKLKPPADATDFKGSLSSSLDKIWAQIRRGVFDYHPNIESRIVLKDEGIQTYYNRSGIGKRKLEKGPLMAVFEPRNGFLNESINGFLTINVEILVYT